MNPSEYKSVFLSGQYKITPAHLQRLAYIYIRQSTLKQVRENFIERLTNLDASVRERVAIHPRLNQPLRPIDMAQFVLEHDEHHIQTFKELIARS